jgi:endo-1,4-beta-xylanase
LPASRRSTILADVRLPVLALTLLLAATTADASCPLRTLAGRTPIRIGAAFVEGSHDPLFRALLPEEFDSVTAPLYWQSTQPTAGAFDFTQSDAALAIAEAHAMRVRGHPLIWGRLALPAYVRNAPDAATLRALVDTQLRTVVGRYAGRIAHYDVVNEPITFFGDPGATDGLDNTVFRRLLGPDYVREMLDLVHALDPAAKLFINDFLVLTPGPKQDRFFRLAEELVQAGAPLHGVGFQGHVRVPFAPGYEPTGAQVEATLRRFAALGLAVEITEMDVTLSSRAPCQLDFQRRTYHDVVAACLAVPGCTGVTTWGITDAFTWITGLFQVDGAPLLFDESYAPKPAYFGVRDALFAGACGTGPACPADCAPVPAPPPPGCCDVTADCGACFDGAVCTDHACGGGVPIECADPCTAAGAGTACVCARRPPDACDAGLPSATAAHVARACGLIGKADARAGGQARRLLTRAATELKRAGRTVRVAARAGDVSVACAEAATAQLADGRERVRAARAAE